MTRKTRHETATAPLNGTANLAWARAEKALRESEERYRSLFDSMDEGFAVCECVRDASGRVSDYRFIELNQSWERQTGTPRASAVGRLKSEILPTLDDDYWVQMFERVVDTGEAVRFERFVEPFQRWYDVRAFPRGNDRLAVLYDDITARKHAELKLKQSEARQAFLLALADRLRILEDPQEIMRTAAEMLARHLGVATVRYTLVESDEDSARVIAGYLDGRLPSPSDGYVFRLSEDTPGWLSLLRAGEEVFSEDLEKDSRQLFSDQVRAHGARAAAAIPLLKNGRLVAILSSRHPDPRIWTEADRSLCREVAERTWAAFERSRAERALQLSEEHMRLAMQTATLVLWSVDIATGNSRWSANYEEVMGFAPETMPTNALERVRKHVLPEDMPFLVDALTKAMRGEADMHIEYGLRIPHTGDVAWIDSHATRVVDPTTGAAHLVGVAKNVTDRKRAEEERTRLLDESQRARRQAEHAMSLRDEFLAVVSHELRTPLSAVLIWAKMLRAGAVKVDDQPHALAVIEQSALAQRQLIDDLLDVARMISGNLRVQAEKAELGPVLAAAVEAVRPMAEGKRIALTMDLGDAPVWSRIDRARLQQVVWNLANNAVKFTPAGGRVAVRLAQLDETVRIEVEDTGPGIASSFLPHVFERFRQEDSSTTRRHGGLGLGLAIARQLVELQGGTIAVKSEGEGRGATFVVELPRAEIGASSNGPQPFENRSPSPTSAPFAPGPVLSGVRVLFVEDEAQTRAAVQWLLEQCGAQVMPAASAREALETFDAANNFDGADAPGDAREQPFDVLVSDVGLPEMDGYKLLAEVRRKAGGARLPSLALTAYAREEDRRRAIEVGFAAYLAKPVEPGTLIDTIVGLLQR